MKLSLVAALILGSVVLMTAQSPIPIGEKCPPLRITDWVQNAPPEQDLENKVIVVDFWATWCGPCLKAVPHFNKLVAEFAGDQRIQFLSMTYERPAKIERTLERIDFRSAVVTDQENWTQEAFGIAEIPYTLVIDAAGKLAWKGNPEFLTPDHIRQVLNGQTPELPSELDSAAPAVDLGKRNIGLKEFGAALKDSTVQRMFQIIPSAGPGGLRMDGLPKMFYEGGTSLPKILSYFFEIPRSRIAMPEKLADQNFNIAFFDKDLLSRAQVDSLMLERFSEEYGVDIQSTTRETDALRIETFDPEKLRPGSGNQGGFSDAGSKLIITNQTIRATLFELENRLGVPLIDQTGLDGKYDFIIEVSDKEQLMESLESYGLRPEPIRAELEFWTVSF
ncbi:redoxin domain-containing protein [Flavilitoribacter nigricans]|uniref:Thioredoxin domain-containing protein n=1 Tax=Flavilitoribacter nigricans (strain ATCC 23147 / DSM 23189 / NBRC 102662 / NCIMB 1420 / SS-2) TaxID=1122177 RepID=A0A2D0N4F0_FLAN2|nr:redoxin domain-containing protein [Flavilitoribacter nigricans]PHN03270.1 hypothetical protein CRP01_28155 [Flavilitoribacter nigricans DSM 23189 = NBRC 102662]